VADTGAPFFLPYPLPSDLVRDGADDIKALAEAMAQALEDIPVTIKKVEAFTGSGTWTVPAGVTYAIAHMMGGGGGVGTDGTGGAGGNSSVAFAAGTVTGSGKNKSAGTDIAPGTTVAGAANTGQNAVYSRSDSNGRFSSDNGAPGVFIVHGGDVTPAESITVTVGAGGAAGTSGAAGGSGYVYIEYYEEV
jgi:hypothetical protein